MVDEPKAGGTADADKTATDTGAGQDLTKAAVDSADNFGLKQRVDGLTAERNRLQDKFNSLSQKYDELAEKTKTEQEKTLDAAKKQAVDEFVITEHEPIKQRLEKIEATLGVHLEKKMQQLSEDDRALVPESLPIDEKLAHVDLLINALAKQKSSLGASANPNKEPGKRTYTLDEIRELGRNPEEWEKMRDDIMAAQKEGRIVKSGA